MAFDLNRDIQIFIMANWINWQSTGEDSAKPTGKSRSICRVAIIV